MATNEVFRDSQWVSLPVPQTIKSGDPVRVGVLNAVAQTDAGVAGPPAVPGGVGNGTGYASVALTGAWRVTVVGALTVGQLVYIKTDNTLTATATGNKVFGAAIFAKGAGTGPATVRLIQTGNDTASA
ncbi:hypothetical protein SEA_MOLIVIA_29 [Arthrobacter phage Molivia]|jgi:predicted RecA/RadA family phage recombinase|uniref:Uncharacterized protein n=1 Tax=Arthrobacter phage Molivia TaxID=2015839 RepID=A0A286N4E6_9CAUD|nr:head decoration [Arthrobacter phage Molivia]ASX99253.1 hypothetical protein SEA_MOLIVIA_29 [Arthrobacter phage Molivia]